MWTEWFQTKKHFVLKNIKPHWTVLYQVKKKWKTLKHLLELRPKRKNNAAQQKMEMNGKVSGNCCQAEFPSDWPCIFTQELCNEAEKTPDFPREGLLGIVSDFLISKFPKCILMWLAIKPASEIKGVWQQSLKGPSILRWWLSNCCHDNSPALRAVAQQSSGVSL